MEFETDDEVEEQSKNANDVKAEGKVRVRKKMVHYYEFSSKEEEGEHANLKKFKLVYDLTPIRGSVMIGNGKSISCTHKGKLDVNCKHRDGSTAREMWEVKIVPQVNHDLFSFTKAMKEGWQMNGRWKEGGLMIEPFKTTKASMKFDTMIPSGSSWLLGIKTQ